MSAVAGATLPALVRTARHLSSTGQEVLLLFSGKTSTALVSIISYRGLAFLSLDFLR